MSEEELAAEKAWEELVQSDDSIAMLEEMIANAENEIEAAEKACE